MKDKTLFICLVFVSVLVVGIAVAVISTDLLRKGVNMKEKEPETKESWVIASEDEVLGKYEKSDRPFKKYMFTNTISYRHQRKIDDAIVGGDYILYLFDKNTKELIEKRIHWRDDLPEHLPLVIPKEQAESMVRGKVQFTDLCFIPPDSPVYPITPTPQNPCWVVRSIDWKGNTIVTIIDAVEGKILGYGVPPP
ncbi:MAG TPA: hypothetical protein C5S37_05505 [Methanophagales archaeon]|nr:hypothetical protein [Methanophagales archaeon]